MKKSALFFSFLCILGSSFSQSAVEIYPGADQNTPSRSEYFSWINNTNEGPTEKQTLINLDFFKWLKDEYGIHLDIYAFDAGAVDGANFYGSMHSARFKKQFPRGFDPIAEKARSISMSLGLWGGPDGFGNTAEEEKQRSDMMLSLVRDYNFSLFKMDGVCGPLRPGKYDAFFNMMNRVRQVNPDLILLNHRLNLGKGMAHSTTYLLGSAETYIDVHMFNKVTAPHHRAGAISRELTPELTRLAEDCGVCLSSCLDYWDDELILQAFNRNLIISPQIYGNPWLLSDDEYPRLARIFNLHRKYNRILVDGIILPEEEYGPKAVSRGDSSTRLLTFRNLTWDPIKYKVSLDQSVGLYKKGKVTVKQYHPTEKIIGNYLYGSAVEIEVSPFRSSLIKISIDRNEEISIEGCHYDVIRDVPGRPMEIALLGMPGEKAKIKLNGNYGNFHTAILNDKNVPGLLKGRSIEVKFPGTAFKEKYHRKLGDMIEIAVPADAMNLYEATCFAADNNALEVRSLYRSGETRIPQVKAARDAFFNQPLFTERDLWDKYLFDGNGKTGLAVVSRFPEIKLSGSGFRIDLGHSIQLDSLVITAADEYSLASWRSGEGVTAYVSKDLVNWESIVFLAGKKMAIDLREADSIRYLRFQYSPLRLTEIIGYKNNKEVSRIHWRASNLFQHYGSKGFETKKAWYERFVLNEVPKGSYLCIAVNGVHGEEKAYASIKIEGKPAGCPDRSPSYQSNVWEYLVKGTDRNYTYYLPLTEDLAGKKIEAFVLGSDDKADLKPEVWVTAYPAPFEKITLRLSE